MQFDDRDRVAKATKKNIVEQTETKNRVELFRHLPQYVHGSQLPSAEAKFFRVQEPGHPHPAVYQVRAQTQSVATIEYEPQTILKDGSPPVER